MSRTGGKKLNLPDFFPWCPRLTENKSPFKLSKIAIDGGWGIKQFR